MAKIVLNVEFNKGTADQQIKALQAELTKVAEAASNVGKSGNLSATIKQVESLRKSAANLYTAINDVSKKFAGGDEGANKLKEIQTELTGIVEETKTLSQRFQEFGSLAEGDAGKVQKMSERMATLSAEVATYKKETERVAAANPFDRDFTSQIQSAIKGYQNLEAHIKSVEKYYAKGTFDSQLATIKQNETALYELQNTYGGTGKMTAEANAKLTEYQKTLGDVTNATKKAENENTNYHGSLQDIVSGFLKFQVAAILVMKPLQALQKAWASLNETLVETEDAVIAIQRVISENLTNSEVANDLYKLAQEYGQTFDNVSEIATNFARQGLSWTEAIDATKAALLALNVAELDATDASEGLVAIMTQFGYEASDLTYVIDVLNKTADNAAVTTEELLTALQKTGSYAKSANLSLEDTVAIITALSESTAASGQNIGNALKSLLSYTTQNSALSTFASLSDEMNTVVEQYKRGGATILDVWKQLSVEMQSLSSEQADLLESWSGDLDDELSGELSEVYDTMKGIYDTAGTYRKNYFIALMSNMDGVLEAQQTISDAAGYSQKENETYLESYTAKLNELQAKWEELANDEQGLLGIKKLFVDIGSAILDVVEWTGGLRTTFIALGTVIAYAFGPTIVTKISTFFNVLKTGLTASASAATKLQAALGWIGLIGVAISTLIGVIQEAVSSAKEAAAQLEEAKEKAVAEANDEVEAYKETAQTISEYAVEVEKLRKILDSETSSTDEKASAQESLLKIQNTLIDSNGNYKDSLDLVNGSLEEQLELIEQLTEEQLKQNAQDFLTENAAKITTAQNAVSNQKYKGYNLAGVRFSSAFQVDQFETKLTSLLKQSGYDVGRRIGDSASTAKITYAAKNTEEALAFDKALLDTIAENWEALGLTAEQEVAMVEEIEDSIKNLNSDTYQEYKTLTETAEAMQQFLDGTITQAEYLEKVYGITQNTTTETEEWSNSLSDVSNKYEDLLEKIKEIREEEKARLDIEEKRQALLNAQNERNVRVFNATTGQWEWQANNDDIADAEEELAEAGWDKIEALLEQDSVTNDEMLEAINSIADLLPDWAEQVKALIKEVASVDLDADAKSNSDSGLSSGGGGGSYVETFKAYDSGGVLSGLGGIKATKEDEIVLPPELTRKILTPTSNEQFRTFAQSLGLMFGAIKNTPVGDGGIVRNQNTTNNNDSRSYTINGVPIAKEQAERYTIAELCEAMDLID